MRYEGRIFRIAEYLLERSYFSSVELVGLGDGILPETEILASGVRIRRFSGSRRARTIGAALYWGLWCLRVFLYYLPKRVTCVNAHSLPVLPLCWLLSKFKACPLIYQPHELETEQDFRDNWIGKRLRQFCERRLISRASRVVAVNEAIGTWYKTAYALSRIGVLRNLPSGAPIDPLPPAYFATRFGFPSSDLVFIYQGLIANGRGIELLIAAFEHVRADRHLVILGFGPLLPVVEAAAARLPNVHFHPAVLPEDLPRFASAADIGLLMIENVSLNNELCYPGKYCEYLTVGRPVMFSDFLWLRQEAETYACGWPAPCKADALATIIANMTRDEIAQKSEGARRWAEQNTWAIERRLLDEIYSDFAGN